VFDGDNESSYNKEVTWIEKNFMNLESLRRDYRNQIYEMAHICYAENIRIFGSVVRGEERQDSDIDFLVHAKPDAGFRIGGLQWRLEELLKCKVDVVLDSSLHPLLKDQILKEAIVL
jgi:predicted nucleotidyltransferase